MFSILLIVVIGIFSSLWIPSNLIHQYSLSIILIAYLVYIRFLNRFAFDSKKASQHLSAFILLLLYVFALFWTQYTIDQRMSARISPQQHGQQVSLIAQINSFPIELEFAQFVLIENNQYRLKSFWPKTTELSPGQSWEVTCKLQMNIPVLSPKAYDPAYQAFLQGIDGGCQVLSSELQSETPGFMDTTRIALRSWILHRNIDDDQKSLLLALVLGDRSWMSAQQKQLLKDSNTSHLFVVSGLHLSLVFLIFYVVFGLLGRLVGFQYWRPVSDLQWFAGISVAVIYAALCGFPIPTQRALIMLLVPCIYHFSRNPIITNQAYWLALLAVLVVDPLAILQFSTWLSFSAVAVLILGLSGRKPIKPSWQYRISNQFFRPQWLIALSLAPLLWLLGQNSNPASLLVNLVAIPLVSFLVLPIIVVMLLNIFVGSSNLSIFLESILGFLLSNLQVLQEWGARLQSNFIPGGNSIILYSLFIVVLLMPAGLPGRITTSALVFVFFLISTSWPAKILPGLNTYLLDVGQGQSIIVQQSDTVVLIDTGPGLPEKGGAFKRVVSPFLRHNNIDKLDAIIFSHSDSDHVSGMKLLPAEIDSALWLFGEPEQKPFNQCAAGQQWQMGDLNVQILSPFSRYPMSGNRASCVVKLESADGCILIPGDIDKYMEYVILADARDSLNCRVLVASHHGSSGSSSAQWIDTIDPELVLFSAGRKNRFGHPTVKVRDKLASRNISWRSTHNEGTLWIQQQAGKIKIEPLVKPVFYWQIQ